MLDEMKCEHELEIDKKDYEIFQLNHKLVSKKDEDKFEQLYKEKIDFIEGKYQLEIEKLRTLLTRDNYLLYQSE